MADVMCRMCGEPFDADEFHEMAALSAVTYDQMWSWFKQYGCPVTVAMDIEITEEDLSVCGAEPVVSDENLATIGVVYDMNRHADDAASDLFDYVR